MEKIDILLLTLLCSAVLFLAAGGMINYLKGHIHNVRYIKLEVDRARERDEYQYWKQELSAARWSILPGITPGRVKAIRRFFCRKKDEKRKK